MTKAKSVRLNKPMREKFIAAVKRDSIGLRPKTGIWCTKWAEHVYDTYFRSLQPLIDKAPEWALHTVPSIYLRLPVKKYNKYAGRTTYGPEFVGLFFDLPHEIAMFSQRLLNGYGTNAKDFKMPTALDNDEITLQFIELQQQKEDWDGKHTELNNQLEELIMKLNTTEQLYKAWPGARKYAHCFPYIPNKVAGSVVTATEMDVSTTMMKATVTSQTKEN